MTNGIFLGGVAQGLQTGAAGARAEDTLDLQQRQQQFKEDQTLEIRQQKAIQNTIKLATEIAQAGGDPAKSSAVLRELAGELSELGASENIVRGVMNMPVKPPKSGKTAKAPTVKTFETPQGKKTLVFNPATGKFEEPDLSGIIAPESEEPKNTRPSGKTGERKVGAFVSAMVDAEKVLREHTVGDVPFDDTVLAAVRGGSETAANFFRSAEGRRYTQAARQWIRSRLRKESGATISDSEFEGEFATFFPAPGDDEGTIERKREARIEAMRSMAAEAGPGFGRNKDLSDIEQIIPKGFPETITEADIQKTMDEEGMTREQVLEFIRINMDQIQVAPSG